MAPGKPRAFILRSCRGRHLAIGHRVPRSFHWRRALGGSIRLAGVGGGVASATLLIGCSVAAPTGSGDPAGRSPAVVQAGSSAVPTAALCPTADPSPVPEASLPADADDETREAARLRTEYGLRHDLAWIRQVAADPTAVLDFGVPMLPAETASLFARNDLPDPVRPILDAYGHTDEFGGLYIDNAQGGVVVLLWTTDPAVHDAAIRPMLPACHPVEFRQVRWSERALRGWQDRISADMDWMTDIAAKAIGVGADTAANVVNIDISSANPDAADLIVAHYAAPDGMIRVISDGTGAHLLPSGTVVGHVLMADGRPPGMNDLMLDAGSPDDPPGWCGGGDIGYGVGEDGRIEFPCKVGRRTILVKDWVPDEHAEHPIVASLIVLVPAGGEVEVEIRLPVGFDPGATP
jgi:hypothetical protein